MCNLLPLKFTFSHLTWCYLILVGYYLVYLYCLVKLIFTLCYCTYYNSISYNLILLSITYIVYWYFYVLCLYFYILFCCEYPVGHCGGVLNASTFLQTMQLPEFPNYPLDCGWQIYTSNGSNGLNISIEAITMNPSCRNFYIRISSRMRLCLLIFFAKFYSVTTILMKIIHAWFTY